ncbi:glycosyltransferase family 39 protein [Paenibacillus larvae]
MKQISKSVKLVWLVLAISFVIKVIVILSQGSSFILDSDDVQYIQTAKIWLETGNFTYNDPSRPTVFITPAYPAFIAFFMSFLGDGFVLEQTIRIVQTLLVTASFYLLFIIGRRVLDERTALIAVILSVLYIPLWHVPNLILTEALFTFLLFLLVYIAMKAVESPNMGWAAAFGLAWAATLYVRPTIALWPGLFLLYIMYRKLVPWKKLIPCLCVTAVFFIACLMPWWIRNYEVSGGTFIPLTKSGGSPLLLGSFPYHIPSVEEMRSWPRVDNLWINDENDVRWAKARIADGFQSKPLLYASWYTIGKFAVFWGDVYYWLPLMDIPLWVPVIMHELLVLAAFVGIWLARKNRRADLLLLLFAYMSILHMVYFPLSRYAIPLLPLLFLFSAHAFIKWKERKSKSKLRVRA